MEFGIRIGFIVVDEVKWMSKLVSWEANARETIC